MELCFNLVFSVERLRLFVRLPGRALITGNLTLKSCADIIFCNFQPVLIFILLTPDLKNCRLSHLQSRHGPLRYSLRTASSELGFLGKIDCNNMRKGSVKRYLVYSPGVISRLTEEECHSTVMKERHDGVVGSN